MLLLLFFDKKDSSCTQNDSAFALLASGMHACHPEGLKDLSVKITNVKILRVLRMTSVLLDYPGGHTCHPEGLKDLSVKIIAIGT